MKLRRVHRCGVTKVFTARTHPFGITCFPFHLPSEGINTPTRAMSRVERYIAYSGCTESGREEFFLCFARSKSYIPSGTANSVSSATKMSLPDIFSNAVPPVKVPNSDTENGFRALPPLAETTKPPIPHSPDGW